MQAYVTAPCTGDDGREELGLRAYVPRVFVWHTIFLLTFITIPCHGMAPHQRNVHISDAHFFFHTDQHEKMWEKEREKERGGLADVGIGNLISAETKRAQFVKQNASPLICVDTHFQRPLLIFMPRTPIAICLLLQTSFNIFRGALRRTWEWKEWGEKRDVNRDDHRNNFTCSHTDRCCRPHKRR